MEEYVTRWLYDPVVGKVIAAVLGVLIVVSIIRLIQRALGRLVEDTSTRYRVRKLMTFIGYFLVIFVLATVFSDKLGGLNVALGVAGAGVAFALQEVIISIAGWFVINFSHFFKTGDRVRVGGINGDVIDIGLLRTTLMEVGEWVNGDLYNGRVVRVANSFVFKDPVFNYSGDFPFLWDEITVPIRYGSDYRLTRELLERTTTETVGEYVEYAAASWKDLVKKYMIENARVAPLVTLTADENWMTFTIRYVVDFRQRRTTKDKLFVRILEEIQKTDGRVSIASTSMEISVTPTAEPPVR